MPTRAESVREWASAGPLVAYVMESEPRRSVYNAPMTTNGRYYSDTGREFITRARTYLAEDDLLKASEKGWGAAAQMVKAAAESRGWRHQSHRDLYGTIDRLVAETGDDGIRLAFGSAGQLHGNFYEGWLSHETVEAHLAEVAELVRKLEAIDA